MFRPVTAKEVELEILALPNNKSHGLHSCLTKLLKYSSAIFSDILAKIVNLTITSGSYPSKLIPVFKTEDEKHENNYRPMSLIYIRQNLVLYKRMMNFINIKNILFSSQYGFREGFSTGHAIADIVSGIQSNMDKRLFTCGIFIH